MLPPLSATKVATLLTILDSLAILTAGYMCYDAVVVYSLAQNLYLAAVVFVWISSLSLMNFGDLYNYDAAARPLGNLHRIIVAIATSFLFLLAAAFSIKVSETLSRLWFSYFAAASMIGVILLRLGFALALRRLLHVNLSKRSVAIVGAGAQGRRLVAAIVKDRNRPLTDIWHLRRYPASGRPADISTEDKKSPAFGLEHLIKQARAGFIDDVVIAIPWQEDDRIMAIVSRLRELPVHVYLLSDLIGFRTKFRSPPSHFGALPNSPGGGKAHVGLGWRMQAGGGLHPCAHNPPVKCAPPAPDSAAVKLDSPGPVLFRQKRLGFNNKIFDVYKFRTMYHAGETSEKNPAGHARRQAHHQSGPLPAALEPRRVAADLQRPEWHACHSSGRAPTPSTTTRSLPVASAATLPGTASSPALPASPRSSGYRGATDTEEKLEGRIRNDIFYAENWSLSLDLLDTDAHACHLR